MSRAALESWALATGSLLPGLEQPLANLALLLRSGVERGDVGKLVEPVEAEQALEQLGGAVEHRAELRAARLLDEAALEQCSDRGLGGHAADARDLGAGDRLH